MQKTAIIGTGIAGMGCGHFLHKHSDLTIYEQNDYVGGHTNTVTVDEGGKPVYVDTGFMVFNFETYPNLCKLFDEIKAPKKKPACHSACSICQAGWSIAAQVLTTFLHNAVTCLILNTLKCLTR